MIRKNIKFKLMIFLVIIFILPLIIGDASFQVTSFSCTPEEVSSGEDFSCTATVQNVGDASGTINIATLVPDGSWMAEKEQGSGTSVDAGNTIQITFTSLSTTTSGINKFKNIRLDSVTDTYVSDNNKKINVIDISLTTSESASSANSGETFDISATAIVGGDIKNNGVSLVFVVDGGGCSIGNQDSTKTMDGSGTVTWQSVEQGTSGDCRYTITATANGEAGFASKSDSSSGTIVCSNCVTEGSSSSSSSGGGSGGIGVTTASIGELPSVYIVELRAGENIGFNFSNIKHYLSVINVTNTNATIVVESEKQTFVLQVGDEISVDLTGDEIAEILIKLKSINVITKKANFILTRLERGVASEKGENLSLSSKSEGEDKKGNGNMNEKIFSLRFFIIFIIVVLIIGIVYYFIKKKKRF